MKVATQPNQALAYASTAKPASVVQGASFANALAVEQASSPNDGGLSQDFASELADQFDVSNLNGEQFDGLMGQLSKAGVLTFEDVGTMLVLGLKWHQPDGLNKGPTIAPTGTQNLLQDAKNYLEFAKQQAPSVVPSLQRLIGIFESIRRAAEQ